MEKKILLCVDATSAQNPELIGLEDEMLDAQPWLVVISDAQEARRRACRDEAINEAWVFSSDSMEGINLAAALRRDARCSEVSLVPFEGTGSVVSRCQAADVGLIRGRDAFVARYSKRKHAALRHVADKAEPVVGVRLIVTNQPEELTDLVVSSDDVLEPQPSRDVRSRSVSQGGQERGVLSSW